MPFAMPRAQTRLLLLLPMLLAVPACAGGPPIVSAQSACSSLLPAEWLDGVEGAPLPAGNTVGDWIAFGDAQTGQLDKANDRYRAAVGVVDRCEARDRAAVRASRPKFLGLF